MKTVTLGRSGLVVTKPAFGALPIQRRTVEEAVPILHKAYENGIRYFDTANGYTDSEEKLGRALADVRDGVILSTKSKGRDYRTFYEHIQISLERMGTDYIDLYQFHQAGKWEDIDGGAYEAALDAKAKGYIRHIGVTCHNIYFAREAALSGRFETVQYPFSYLSTPEEFELVELCRQQNVGFIAMKALAGGLLSEPRVVHAFMRQYPHVAPIYGIQTMEELDQWLAVAEEDPAMTDAFQAVIDRDREQLSGQFCRGCGYCMPCPAGIPINSCARMKLFLRRRPWRQFYSPEWKEKMERIRGCLHCGRCMSRCPYGLDTPALLQDALEDYWAFYEEHKAEL